MYFICICIQLVTRSYYDGQPLTVNKSPNIDERNNGDYEDLDSTGHRIPSYLNSRGGGTSSSRIKYKKCMGLDKRKVDKFNFSDR